ncbi:MAG: class I SAM-dependent methyltransferase [Solirubrobacterales bacterium]
MPTEAKTESGSFRDRDSRVALRGESVYRALSPRGEEDWRALRDSPLFAELTSSGSLVGTEEVPVGELGDLAAGLLPDGVASALRHERVPFVSYPYEWTFGMLREAALLQLDTELAALEAGLTLKDATPYNVQFVGSRPVFIDVGSFEPQREGEPWAGYRQFCMLYLYPLMLQAYRDVPFQPWLRGSIDGISPREAANLLSLRDRLRRGVLTHVALHARLERRFEEREGGEVKEDLKKANFKTDYVKANLRRMRKLVERLSWKAGETAWTGYRERNTYTDEDTERKRDFVRSAVAGASPDLVWDMGCNDGAFARLAAETAGSVVAFDYDQATVDALYRSLREAGEERILPLVANLADPSPGLGWRGLERRPLEGRGRPDLVLALALVHHVSITANVPLAEFLDWLRGLGAAVVIEFPKREDPMVRRLLSGKREGSNADYRLETFEAELGRRFEVRRTESLPSGTRVLYEAHP